MSRPDALKRYADRWLTKPHEYAPLLHQALWLIERDRLSASQAASKIGKSRSWIFRLVARSRNGDALAWIAVEWDRIRAKNMRCDLCGSPFVPGTGRTVHERSMRIDLCSPACETAWVDVDEGEG